MFGGFSGTKLKPQLKMAASRIQIASNKKAALLKQNMREIAVMLAEDPPKEEKAKIRAEALIRDDNLIEAYEILQLECELLHERIKLIEFSKECPADLVPVISTLMWASHRVDIPELLLIRKQFRAKYGKKFEEAAMTNVECLNERVVSKLSVEPPAAYLVQTYLERICEQFQVDWKPKVKLTAEEMIEPMAAPVGYSVAAAQGTGLGPTPYPPPVGGPSGQAPPRPLTLEEEYKMAGAGMPLPDQDAATTPVVTAKPYVPSGSNSNIQDAEIIVPPSSAPAAFGASDNVSTLSSSQATANFENGAGAKKDNRNDDDDDENDNNDQGGAASNSGGSAGASKSYADLAARFEQLSK